MMAVVSPPGTRVAACFFWILDFVWVVWILFGLFGLFGC
jgi:hypothetical protein